MPQHGHLLTLEAPPIICSRQHLKNFRFKKKIKIGHEFHENCLLVDNSHENHASFLLKIRKDIADFVVCCSPDWRFKG